MQNIYKDVHRIIVYSIKSWEKPNTHREEISSINNDGMGYDAKIVTDVWYMELDVLIYETMYFIHDKKLLVQYYLCASSIVNILQT